MAKLTTCGTCGHQVSSTATQCPNCGQKFKKKTSIFTWAVAGLIGVPFLFGIFKSANNPPPQVAEQSTQQQVAQQSTVSESPIELKKVDKNYKKIKQMDYETCLGVQKIYNDTLGKNHKYIELKKTDSKSVIKYCAADGATSVTCDKNKNTMTLAWADMSGC